MKYVATIEIPKDSPRRIHKSYDPEKEGAFVDLGLISEKNTANGGLMPLAYGFIEGTVGSDGEGDEVDVMIFSTNEFKTGDSVEVWPFATMIRDDGDYKVLAHDGTVDIASWDEIPADMQNILMEFNGFHHPIMEVKDAQETQSYIKEAEKAL